MTFAGGKKAREKHRPNQMGKVQDIRASFSRLHQRALRALPSLPFPRALAAGNAQNAIALSLFRLPKLASRRGETGVGEKKAMCCFFEC